MKECQSLLGLSNLGTYQTSFPLKSPYGVESDVPVFLPLYTTWPLNQPNSSIKVALVFLHGLLSNANTYFCIGLWAALAQRQVHPSEVLVVQPWFGNETVTAKYWAGGGDGVSTQFHKTAWLYGRNCNASTPGPKSVGYTTSLDAIDDIVLALQDGTFPNLKVINVGGFSAGGQLAQRYALVSSVPTRKGLAEVHLFVGDPSTYAYLDARRPVDSCRPAKDTGTGWACTSFAVPSPAEVARCGDYNQWMYGLGGGFNDSNYLAYLEGNTSAQVALAQQFRDKHVVFYTGNIDVCNCALANFTNPASCFHPDATCAPSRFGPHCCDTYPDGTNDAVGTKCADLAQGTSRLQRARNFMSYLADFFPGYAPTWTTFPGAHDVKALMSFEPFQRATFGVGHMDRGDRSEAMISV